MKDNDLTLVWVEVGRNVPRYLKRSIKLHRKIYPDAQLILLTDRSYKDESLTQVLNINEWSRSTLHNQFEEINKVWDSHQKEFWINTTKRFFVLYDFLLSSGLNTIVHLESDVILLNGRAAMEVCEKIKASNRIAYPMYNESSGSAGIIFVPNVDSLKKFLEFVVCNWEQEGETDMSLLAKYRSSSFILNNGLNCGIETQSISLTGIWDGGRLGQYFLGTDARNCRLPMSVLYKSDLISRSDFDYLRRVGLTIGLTASNRMKSPDKSLAAIHLHNKLVPVTKFSLFFQLQLSYQFSKYRRFINLYRIDFIVLTERMVGFLNRRFKGDHSEVNLR